MIFVFESKLCMATLVFYTCIYIPYLRLKHALLSILGFFLCIHHYPLQCSDHQVAIDSKEMCLIDLPMSRYGDLKSSGSCSNVDGDHDDACSVCLVEFEGEDLVSQLSKCGHVFHMVCIEKWVDRNQFTCPLCRSSFLNMHGSSSHASCDNMLSCVSRVAR